MKTRLTFNVASALLALSIVGPQFPIAQAGPGDLDTSFAGTGITRIGFGFGHDEAYAVATQSDGKLILAGVSANSVSLLGPRMFSLVRLDTNNIPDTSFGDGGMVLTPVTGPGLPNPDARVNAVKVQSDGKIVAAGYADIATNYSTFTLARYNPDGSLDTTFGTNGTGIVYTDFGQESVIRAMAIQSDGKILVVGYLVVPFNGGGDHFALARYQTNGVLDASFGSGGIQTTADGSQYCAAYGLMIQPDGKILAVGIGHQPPSAGVDFALYRYTTNGVLDSAFGGGTGMVFTRIGANTYDDDQNSANAVAYQSGDGTHGNPDKIFVAGFHRNSSNKIVFALTRYDLDGTLDTAFGTGGFVTNSITSGAGIFDGDTAISLVIQGSIFQPHKYVLGGYSRAGGTNYFTLARYTATGAFDTTFGTNGTGAITIPFSPGVDARANAMALQSGKFVLAGYSGISSHNYDFEAVRFNSSGSLDTSFGNGGLLPVDIATLDSAAYGMAIQPDDKMVVGGGANNASNNVFAVARFNVDGSLDSSFGVNGRVTTPIGTFSATANAVVVQPDGKLVVAGSAYGANEDFAVARYHPDGTLDTSFGTGGIALTPIGTGQDVANAIALQPDGKLVVAGTSRNATDNDFAVVRYTTNGIPDPTFDGDGKLTTAIATGDDYGYAVKIQADGKIVVAGYADISGNIDFALVRYNTNGSLDNSFGFFGRVTTDIGGSTDGGFALAIQPNGRIIVAGVSANGPVGDVALVRYTNDVPDVSFGGDGKVTTPIGFGTAYARALALQPDGRIVAAGFSYVGAHPEFAALRYNTDGSLDGSFGDGGTRVVEFGDSADNLGYALVLDSIGRAVIAGDAGGLFGVLRLLGDALPAVSLSISLTSSNAAVISWPYPSTGWNLQQNTNLNTTNWVAPSETVTDDSTNNFIIVNPPTGNRFFRLMHP